MLSSKKIPQSPQGLRYVIFRFFAFRFFAQLWAAFRRKIRHWISSLPLIQGVNDILLRLPPNCFVDRGSIMYNAKILRRKRQENAKSRRKFRQDTAVKNRIKSTFVEI